MFLPTSHELAQQVQDSFEKPSPSPSPFNQKLLKRFHSCAETTHMGVYPSPNPWKVRNIDQSTQPPGGEGRSPGERPASTRDRPKRRARREAGRCWESSVCFKTEFVCESVQICRSIANKFQRPGIGEER